MGMKTPIKLTWGGRDYKILVTMEVIDRLEDHLNLWKILTQTSEKDIRFSKIAKLIALLLNEGGCDTTQEKVYEGMFGQGSVSAKDLTPMLAQIFAAVYPTPKKKDVTPKSKGPKKSTKAPGMTSTNLQSVNSG